MEQPFNFRDAELHISAESELIHAVVVLAVKEYLTPKPKVDALLFFSNHPEWAKHRAYLLGLIGVDDTLFMQKLISKKANKNDSKRNR
jgi:hypothetical protein